MAAAHTSLGDAGTTLGTRRITASGGLRARCCFVHHKYAQRVVNWVLAARSSLEDAGKTACYRATEFMLVATGMFAATTLALQPPIKLFLPLLPAIASLVRLPRGLLWSVRCCSRRLLVRC